MVDSQCPECGATIQVDDRRYLRVVRWAVAIVYTIFIFSFAPLVLPVWKAISSAVGTEKTGFFVNRSVAVLGLLAAFAILWKMRKMSAGAHTWIVAVVAGYAYLITLHCDYPIERIHLVQYCLVAWVYFRASQVDLEKRGAYFAAAAGVFCVGILDEMFQGLVPDRSSTIQDTITNWSAGSLGLIALMAIRGDGLWGWFNRRGSAIRFAAGYAVPALVTVVVAQQVWTRYIHPPLNLVIITVDCARPDRMGVYGYEKDTTKWLDEIAGDMAIFTNAFSQAAWTSPGVVSTLTGLYPPTHGVVKRGETVPETVTTLLDAFHEHGYRIPDMTYLTEVPNFQNLGDFEDPAEDVGTRDELEVLKEWIDENHSDPFALWYHYRYVHLPYDAADHHQVFPPADIPSAVLLAPPEIEEWIQKEVIIPKGAIEFTVEHKPWIDALYDAEIRQFDAVFESIRYRLSLHNKLKNTIFIITADHGEELLEHGYIGHASTAVHSQHYDESIRIPLLIHCPREIPEGRVIDTMAQQVDILPTVFDMMGWEIPEEVQGRSLLPAILGEEMEDVPVFAESIEGGYQSKPEMQSTFVRSVRTKEWKFIARMAPEGHEYELYNLVDDPAELRNVFEDYPAIGGGFIRQLLDWRRDNAVARAAIEEREAKLQREAAALDPANLTVPEILKPADGSILFYETSGGAVKAEWTGNPDAAYVIEYDIGEGWHNLKGLYPVEIGSEHTFGPLPPDGWKPLYQWNPYRLRVRPQGLPDGWSEWITLEIAPLKE